MVLPDWPNQEPTDYKNAIDATAADHESRITAAEVKTQFATGTVTLNLLATVGDVDTVRIEHGLGDVPVDFGASVHSNNLTDFELIGLVNSTAEGQFSQYIWTNGDGTNSLPNPLVGQISFLAESRTSITGATLTVKWWARKR